MGTQTAALQQLLHGRDPGACEHTWGWEDRNRSQTRSERQQQRVLQGAASLGDPLEGFTQF